MKDQYRQGGRDVFKWFVGNFRNAHPGLSFTIEDMLGEDDKVATRVTIRSQARSWTGIGIVRIFEGQIAEQWADVGAVGSSK